VQFPPHHPKHSIALNFGASVRGVRCLAGWQAAKPNPDRGEDRIADGGRHDGCAGLAEADWGFCTVNELDFKLRHVADPQRRISVEVCVLHLTSDEQSAIYLFCSSVRVSGQ
jgi:hypothetical protein